MTIHFLPGGGKTNITSIKDLKVEPESEEAILRELVWFYMIERGFWIARRGMLSLILGTSNEEIEQFIDAVRDFLNDFKEFVSLR
jgi:glutamate-1-semialdehyde 2,1-aminomutase